MAMSGSLEVPTYNFQVGHTTGTVQQIAESKVPVQWL